KENLIKEKDVTVALPNALKILKELAKAEKVCVFQNTFLKEGVRIKLMFGYADEEITGNDTEIWEFKNNGGLNFWFRKMQGGKKIKFHIDNFPEDLEVIFKASDTKSVLLKPIFIDDNFFGFISFESTNLIKQWNELEEFSFQSVANSIGRIMQRNEMLMQLEISKEELTRLNDKVNFELDSFFYSASHDLRRPVTTALGLISLASQSQDVEERKQYLTFLQQTLVKLDQLILDIIQISKNKTLAVNKTDKINYESFFQDIFQDLKYYENADKIEMILSVSQGDAFLSDTKRLKAIFSNLIANAMKYHNLFQSHPKIKITVEVNQAEANIAIEDNGIGIPEEHLSKLFDVFYRANENKSGSGLGLYIVKETVIKLGGEISVTSEVNKGTTFYVNLPNYTLSPNEAFIDQQTQKNF
ncbi:MAG: HAMP domain-containing sensor histidine kinase, partial [Bacteroidota bacterium]